MSNVLESNALLSELLTLENDENPPVEPNAEATGKKLEKIAKGKLKELGYELDDTGGNAQPYDLQIVKIPKGGELVVGKYEVKLMTTRGGQTYLSRLGSQKAREVLSAPLMRSIMRLGQELLSIKWDNPNFETFRSHFMESTGSRLSRAQAYAGLEISSSRVDEILFSSKEPPGLRDMLNRFLIEIKKQSGVRVRTSKGLTSKIAIDVTGDGKTPDDVEFAVPTKSYIEKVQPVIQGLKDSAMDSDGDNFAKLLPAIRDVLDKIPRNPSTWKAELAALSTGDVKGILGVDNGGDVRFFDKDQLTFDSITQGGRLKLVVRPGRKGILLADPQTKKSKRPKKSQDPNDPEGMPMDEISMGGVAGVTTPLGTDASGGKGGPGVRKGRGKSILDKNAKSQGKFFGGAKPVTEASTIPISISVGVYGTQYDSSAGDFDGDGDTDVRNDTKRDRGSVYRGGNGDLQHNARQIGRHFAGAEVIDDTYEMLQDLLTGKELTPAQTKRFKRSSIVGESTRRTPGLVAAINDIHPKLLDETHVRLVLGCDPLPLNEGSIGEAHLRLLLREQLLYEGWWDSAKQLLGQGIDKVKEKAEDAKEAVEAFGKNTKGVVAALWLSTTDGKLLEALVAATRHRLSKGLKAFLKPLYRVANFFKDVSDIPKKVVDKIASGLDKFMEGLRSPGWKGLLTSMAAYLGYRWLVDTFAEKVNKIVDDYTGDVKDATLDKAKSLGNALTGGLIDEMQEKLGSIVKELAGSAIEQLAGPLAWVKKLVKIFEKVDWVTSNLIGIVSMGQFAAGIGKPS